MTSLSRKEMLEFSLIASERSENAQAKQESFWARIRRWKQRMHERKQLLAMPDYLLKDIGVTRAQAESEWRKPFWQE